ncbi:MAG: o-succinylbenzoate--CoA ligase [Steroidobacteraceae bacterium]|nr:o-succinylbenzoate--CoA ligase [Steroidobacteraceae bacterium]
MSERHDLCWRAALTPDAPALESRGQVWSFAELADRARRGAAFLQSMVRPSAAPIALLMRGDAPFAAWLHAVVAIGRAVLPLNQRLTAAELAQQLAQARAACVLGEAGDSRLDEIRARVPGLAVAVAPPLDSLPRTREPHAMAAREGDAVFAVLYTSGTTGRAKGACLTWNNFDASARAAEDRLGVVVRQRWLACMPLFHVGGLSILVRSVLYGGPVRLLSPFDAAAVSDLLDGGDIAGVSLVPTMLSRLLAHRGARAAPPGLRVLLLGGAAAAPELTSRAMAAGYPVCTTYGLTEAASQVATAAPPPVGAVAPSTMLPMTGTEIRIETDGVSVPPGATGEILVRGPTVMRGYLDDAAATARVLRDGWLHTGDVGYLDASGGLHVLDRRDDLVVSGGENVYPAEIEAVLLEHPAVEDAGVTGVPDADLGARVVAWIVPAPGVVADAEELRRHCRAQLAGFKQPREYRFVAALPRNAAGKLQRRRLPGS